MKALSTNKPLFLFALILLGFVLLRLPSLIEPHWYGDEGIYQAIGLAMTKGRILYAQIWDNKPPLLYVMYALTHADQFMTRLLSLFFGLSAVIAFFFLAERLFKKSTISLVSTGIFALLFATPATEGNIANAENFMLFFTITAGLLLYNYFENVSLNALNKQKRILISSGILLGIAFLFKIVALFDLAAFLSFACIVSLQNSIDKKHILNLIKQLLIILLGFALPILFTILYFAMHQALGAFLTATFFSNISYVGYKNHFLIPQGLLILKLLLLGLAMLALFIKRKIFTSSEIFIFSWFAFSLFNVFFSQRPYTHYVLVGIPSFALITSYFLWSWRKHVFILLIVCVASFMTFNTFRPFPKTIPYYKNYLAFLTNQKTLEAYQTYFDRDVLRDNNIATFIKLHSNGENTVFLWGNSAQIYAMSNTLPPGKYTVAYHISSNKKSLAETQQALDEKKPRFVILLPDSPSPNLSLQNYRYKLTIDGANIYERYN